MITYLHFEHIIELGNKSISYNSDGLVSSLIDGENASAFYRYGVNDELVEQRSFEGFNRFTTRYFGAVEIMREEYAPPFIPSPELTRVKTLINTPNGVVGYHEKIFWHHPKKQTWHFNEVSLPIFQSERTSYHLQLMSF